MAAAPIKIYVDVVNNVAYSRPSGGSVFSIPPLYFGSVLNLQIFPMTPAANAAPTSPQFIPIVATGLGLTMSIGPIDGTFAPLARQDIWVVDPTGTYLFAALNLNTSNIETALGNASSIGSVFNITLIDTDASKRVILQSACTINEVVENPSGAAPVIVPGLQFLTSQETDQIYLRKINLPGVVVQFTSGNGAHTRTIGTDNQGNGTDIQT